MTRKETQEQRTKNMAREYYNEIQMNIHCQRWQDLREEEQEEWVKRYLEHLDWLDTKRRTSLDM